MNTDLNALRAKARNLYAEHEAVFARKYTGLDHWHWSRAVAHMKGENVRRNDDTSRDAELAADPELRATWDAYITALHAFYRARDGERGFLGSRGFSGMREKKP